MKSILLYKEHKAHCTIYIAWITANSIFERTQYTFDAINYVHLSKVCEVISNMYNIIMGEINVACTSIRSKLCNNYRTIPWPP